MNRRGDCLMKKVAFVCVHNSCRSQMAEAFCGVLGLDVIEPFSAGTEKKNQINKDAVRIMKEIGVDMEIHQYSKLLNEIPKVDIVITMGCNVKCPLVQCSHREDWGLEDPSGKSDIEFRKTRNLIQKKVDDLIYRVKSGII